MGRPTVRRTVLVVKTHLRTFNYYFNYFKYNYKFNFFLYIIQKGILKSTSYTLITHHHNNIVRTPHIPYTIYDTLVKVGNVITKLTT